MSADQHPSRFELEAYSVGEGTPETREHVAGCLVCRRVLQAIGAERERFLQAQPFELWAERLNVNDQVAASGMPRRGWLAAAVVIATAAAAFAVWVAAPEPNQVRLKGSGLVLEAVRAQGSEQTRHQGRVTIEAGDRLRFLVHLDAIARVELWLEEEGGPTLELIPAGGAALDVGTHTLPDDALQVEPPVRPAVVRLRVKYEDGTEREAILELVPDG